MHTYTCSISPLQIDLLGIFLQKELEDGNKRLLVSCILLSWLFFNTTTTAGHSDYSLAGQVYDRT